MQSVEIIDTYHTDVIHDVCYDYYGKRLATCSSDQKVKIFNKITEQNEHKWILSYEWKAHDAAIFKVQWAHPNFGTIIATCSYDKSVQIWEERIVFYTC